MAKLVALTWFPRSYIHLTETYGGLGKLKAKVSNIELDEKLSFDVEGFRDYERIKFTQEWSGLHYFIVEVPDENVKAAARKFMGDMQYLLIEEILRVCHTVSYNQIMSNIIPLDFHLMIFSNDGFSVEGLVEKKAGDLRIHYDPNAMYSSGNMTYVFGSEDESMLDVLLYHGYVEVTADFMSAMIKKMTRLYHEAENVVAAVEKTRKPDDMRKQTDVMDKVIKESSGSYGKIRQAVSNFGHKFVEYRSLALDGRQKDLADALRIGECFKRLEADGNYTLVLWSDVLVDYLKNVNSSIESKLLLAQAAKKRGWLF